MTHLNKKPFYIHRSICLTEKILIQIVLKVVTYWLVLLLSWILLALTHISLVDECSGSNASWLERPPPCCYHGRGDTWSSEPPSLPRCLPPSRLAHGGSSKNTLWAPFWPRAQIQKALYTIQRVYIPRLQLSDTHCYSESFVQLWNVATV